ncbi:MAG: hypothetical protein HYR94_02210 [Chloroflexi bacterium]|nr:hypothetical protein [Chloroflexota bacterium]
MTWTYTYSGNHYLYIITDPDDKVVEKTFFDSQGRATQQLDGLDQAIIQISYPSAYTRVITEAGKVMTDTHNTQNLFVGQVDALNDVLTYTFDSSFNRNSSADANGNPPTAYARTPFGLTTAVTDALGFTTTFSYDSRNNLTRTVDARGTATTYTYDAQNNLKTVTTVSGTTTYTYNTAGQVTAMTDENNQSTQYGYDALGQRTVITDALSNVIRYEYDGLGRVITTTDPLNKITVNQYDAADHLLRVTENYTSNGSAPANEYNLVTQYAYDGAGRQTVITDTLGRVTRNEYDNAGRLLKTTENWLTGQLQNYQNTYNIITTYGYDSFGRQSAITDTLNHVTRTFYDTAGRVERTVVNYIDGTYNSSQPDEDIITRYEYDKNGNVTKTVALVGGPEERATCTEYDALNRVEQTIENCQDGQHGGGDGPDEDLVTTYDYDAVGNQITVTAPLNRVTRYDYDSLNRAITMTNPISGLTTYSYDPVGNRTQIVNPKSQIQNFQYDALNRVVTTTNALQGQTITSYDPAGNQKKVIDANTNPLTYTYDSMYRLIGLTDAENQTTSYTYDALGNKLTETDPLNRVTRNEYDSLNRLITTTQNYVSGGPTDATTNVKTVYAYDVLGNRSSMKDPNSNTTTYSYDDLNRLTQIVNPKSSIVNQYDGLGNRVSLTNGLTQTTVYTYDGVSRLVGLRNPAGQVTTYTYNEAGERTAMLDANTVKTSYEYDALGRLTTVIENDVASPSGPDQDVTTRYGYDAVGNRTVITNALSFTTTYVYDALNRQSEARDALYPVTRYGYDAVGNRKVITDANTAVTHFNYDKVNRLTGIDYPTITDVSLTYDKLGNRLTMLDGTGTTTYTYDSLYRLTTSKNGAGQLVQYGYDAVGSRTRLTYPDGKVITYTYDTANRLDTVQDWSNGVYTYTYDAADQLTTLKLPNGVTSTYTYDTAGRLTRLTHSVITGDIAIYDYSLDVVGNRKRVTETLVLPAAGSPPLSAFSLAPPPLPGIPVTPTFTSTLVLTSGLSAGSALYLPLVLKGSSSAAPPPALPPPPPPPLAAGPALTRTIVYTYDKLYHLTNANYSTGETYTYTYDAAGNRKNQTALGQTTVYTYDAANRLVNAGGQTYTFDNNGNLLNTGVMTNSFDVANRLITTTRAATTLQVTYNGINDRVAQTDGATTTNYALDVAAGLPEVISTTKGTAYLHLPGVIMGQNASGQRVYMLGDGLGSIRQVISGTTVAAWREYDPYGQPRAASSFCNTFDSGLEGWSVYSYYATPGVLSNPAGLMRLASGGNPSGITVKKNLSGAPGSLTVSAVFTTTSPTTVQFWVEYTDGSTYYIFSNGTTPWGTTRYTPSYTTPGDKVPVALYFYAAASGLFPPYQVDVDQVCVTPVVASQAAVNPAYGFSGEWWEQDVQLLHLRARWYDVQNGIFLSKDAWPGDVMRPQSLNGWSYVEGNPVNLTDPSGYCSQLPQIGPTKCEKFVAEVERFIALSQQAQQDACQFELSRLALYFCSRSPNNIPIFGVPPGLSSTRDDNTVMMLAHYYAGITLGPPPLNVPNLTQRAPEIWDAKIDSNPQKSIYSLDNPKERYDLSVLQEERTAALNYGFKRFMFDNTHHYFVVFYYAWFWTSLGGATMNEGWELIGNAQLGGERDVADVATARLAIRHMRHVHGWFYNELSLLPSLLRRDVCADSIEAIYAEWDDLQRFR